MVGQPGARAAPPRSPHHRVLPPTMEPGLWAGDQPRGSGDYWKTMDPVAWGVRLPFLDEPMDPYQTTVHQQTVRRCAFIIGAVGLEQATHVDLKALSLAERQCFVARMFEHCTNADRTQVEFFETYGPPLRDAFRDMLRRTRVSAAVFERESCTKGDTQAVREAVANAIRAWNVFSGRINAVH